MKIEVLGPGCPKCKKTFANAEEALRSAGIQAELIKIEKIDQIVKYGVMMTPALVIDGNVKCAGRVPSVEQIKEWLNKN
jgi:small redox-active disulfide protein 2